MVTVILNRSANPRVTPSTGAGLSQVVIEFPQARAANLPETLAGDESLVQSLKTEVSATGVKIMVAMFPGRPYYMSREILPLSKGLAMFRLGLRFDPHAVQAKEAPPAGYPPPPPAQASKKVLKPGPGRPSRRHRPLRRRFQIKAWSKIVRFIRNWLNSIG